MSFEIIRAKNGVNFLKSDKIPFNHGFSTRIGGDFETNHTASLNLAFDRGDSDKTVLHNLSLFCEAAGVCPESVISLKQVHSDKVLEVSEQMCGRGYFVKSENFADGYVTGKKGITLGVKTADCVPILFADNTAGIVGAAHAGWRGTVFGIAAKCVAEMEKLGACKSDIKIAIGPSIHSCCFEVKEDFIESVSEIAGTSFADRFIFKKDGNFFADIVGMNIDFLKEVGIRQDNIDVCSYCTCCNPRLFYSHRYSKGLRGTMLSIISM